jgi:hypothetical protein
MSQSSADAIAALTFGFLPPMTEKLTRGNYAMWHAQVSSTINGAQLAGFIKTGATPPAQFMEVDPADITAGKKADLVPNPEHDKWLERINRSLASYLDHCRRKCSPRSPRRQLRPNSTPLFRDYMHRSLAHG